MPHTVLLCLPLVFIRYMSVCAAHRKLHFSSSPLLTAAYAYTVSACLAATAPLVRRSPRPAPNRLRRTRVARARRPSPPLLPRQPPASASAAHTSPTRPAAPPSFARRTHRPSSRRATPHPPPLAPPFLARRSSRARPSPRRSFETACFRFFAKHFKLCGQLTERK